MWTKEHAMTLIPTMIIFILIAALVGYLMRNKSEADGEDVYLSHINAKLLMNAGDYREAARVLRVALTSGEEMPAPVMYFVFNDLERACKELLDYKGAYEYSNGKIALMEKFLR